MPYARQLHAIPFRAVVTLEKAERHASFGSIHRNVTCDCWIAQEGAVPAVSPCFGKEETSTGSFVW